MTKSRHKLAILTTHPIQYHTPWYQAMAACPRLDCEVLFCHQATPTEQSSAGFGVAFEWDTPLLDGYRYRVLRNIAPQPSVNSFFGIDTPELRGIIAEGRYDAVLVSGWHYKSAWQGITSCWRTNTPVMVRGDSHLYSPRHQIKTVLKRLPYRYFIRRMDACLAVGRWSREYYLAYGASPDRIFFVPHAIDDRFSNARSVSDRAHLRSKWGLRDGCVVFLFVGKFVTGKRPLDFVEAIEGAVRRGCSVEGLMVGDGALRAECERVARDRQLPIRFAGFLNQSKIAEAYFASDVLVLPSDGWETWGLVVNEAMTCGLPCIVSDRVGAGPDLVMPDQTGWVFRLGDVVGIANLMCRYAENWPNIKIMGDNARRLVAKYSIHAAVDGVIEALDSIQESRT
jgi:glycosyltransferase involved in cell wall biosynthesis